MVIINTKFDLSLIKKKKKKNMKRAGYANPKRTGHQQGFNITRHSRTRTPKINDMFLLGNAFRIFSKAFV